ncbi:MAG: Do family serine endopeptidase [Gemmatimonadetes bacterium]|nr:Do family serine endopeptidase [Gemmatimonadota bacterium]
MKLSAIIAVAFALGLAFASGLDLPRPGVAQQARPTTEAPASGAAPTRIADGPLPSFATIVDRVNPAVVFVRTDRRERATAPMRGVPPEFDDFFRRFQPPVPRYREGSGSGFIVSQDGYILTNNHVVAGADHVWVKLLDNREFEARVVGRDPNTDVAVIKIDATRLPAAAFGNSDQTRIGDWVLAIGNPLGFTFTVTAGIVSAKGRTLEGLRDPDQRYTIQDFIQTDAAINPGNSGGPLVNLQGEVVGINSAIASQTGLYSGYGFAIPINLARRVMDDLIATGHVSRAILGISIREITPEDAEYVGLREIRGVVVNEFPAGNSPARSAGIQPGDVIVALNDSAVAHVSQLQQMVGFRRPGEVVRVQVVRQRGERRTFEVRLAAADDDRGEVARADRGRDKPAAAPSEMEGRLGLQVEPLPTELARRARLSEDQRGVLVTDVEEGGPSWGRIAAPQNGGPEVILWINQERVRSYEDFQRAVRAARRGEVVQLRVLNLASGQTRIVRIRARS